MNFFLTFWWHHQGFWHVHSSSLKSLKSHSKIYHNLIFWQGSSQLRLCTDFYIYIFLTCYYACEFLNVQTEYKAINKSFKQRFCKVHVFSQFIFIWLLAIKFEEISFYYKKCMWERRLVHMFLDCNEYHVTSHHGKMWQTTSKFPTKLF